MTTLRPFFCPECERTRGLKTKTVLVRHEDFYYESFGMCTECYFFLQSAPKEVVEANIKAYDNKQTELRESENKEVKNLRVYFVDSSENFSKLKFVNNLIKPHEFTHVFLERSHYITKIHYSLVHKLKIKTYFAEAEKINNILKHHNIIAWIEEEL